MSGETLPLNQHDEASVFTSGSLLTAQNGFTGYWQAPDQGSFSYPFEGLDSDFIQVNPIADQHNVFTVLSDLFLVSGQPVAVQAGESDYVLPEVQIIDVMIWQQVQMADGSYAYVEVGEATEIPDQILSSYYNGGLGNTAETHSEVIETTVDRAIERAEERLGALADAVKSEANQTAGAVGRAAEHTTA